ncbi:DUF6289 family protein [Marilutibacter alkalisoli]|uniref:Uncharacterized protein n=1 Tax=Marilutibacter alkalisoli TaxID=2591633 RepID=A0A514BSE4_9GAMM|nr:DUF6289 family protein [Lysobacter alkalisoli]QDH70304.1 hypothetical protein FKV23_09540 [Lysobacter alkalisoli]
MRRKLVIGLGLATALAAGTAIAAYGNNGDMGVFLDANGNVVGTWVIGCDGQFSYEGERTKSAVKNGSLFCNPR